MVPLQLLMQAASGPVGSDDDDGEEDDGAGEDGEVQDDAEGDDPEEPEEVPWRREKPGGEEGG
jgi:hypothetical protein